MKPCQLWPGLLFSILLIGGCQQSDTGDADDASVETSADSNEDKNSNGESEEDSPAIPVETAFATRGDVYASYTGTAPVEAFQDATVIAKVGGEVREILVEEGDFVKAGQILARLDGDRLRLEQMQTEANLHKLERDHSRNLDLSERGLISAGDFEKIQYEMEALSATNDLAKLQLSYADIRAPISGVISERFIKVGNTLEVENQAFQITSLEPLISYLHVPEREFRKITAGQSVAMFVDALEGTSFEGVVARVSPVVDALTGTFKITIEVSDDTRRLKPGMFARVAIVQDVHVNVLQVPRSALINEAGKSSIFIVEDNVAHERIVETGYSADGRIEIATGLSDSDEFVVVGQAGLKDGAKVSIIGADVPASKTAKNHADE